MIDLQGKSEAWLRERVAEAIPYMREEHAAAVEELIFRLDNGLRAAWQSNAALEEMVRRCDEG